MHIKEEGDGVGEREEWSAPEELSFFPFLLAKSAQIPSIWKMDQQM